MSDFSKKQPTPQTRPSTEYLPTEGVATFYTPEGDDAPTVGLPVTGAGPGVPANKRTIR